MKIWERIIEARLRDIIEISKQQHGFMPEKGTTNAMFALRMLMEKYKKGQRELHVQQSSAGRAMVLYEKIRKSRKVCATRTGYVQGNRNSGEVCNRNYRKFQGQDWTAPGISVKSVPVCSDN